MSNGVAKLLESSPKAREVDLLSDFYRAWWDNFQYASKLDKKNISDDQRVILQGFAQEITDAHLAIQYYRGRNNRDR